MRNFWLHLSFPFFLEYSFSKSYLRYQRWIIMAALRSPSYIWAESILNAERYLCAERDRFLFSFNAAELFPLERNAQILCYLLAEIERLCSWSKLGERDLFTANSLPVTGSKCSYLFYLYILPGYSLLLETDLLTLISVLACDLGLLPLPKGVLPYSWVISILTGSSYCSWWASYLIFFLSKELSS